MKDLVWILFRGDKATLLDVRETLSLHFQVHDDEHGYSITASEGTTFRVTARDASRTVDWIAKQLEYRGTKVGAKRAKQFRTAGFDCCIQIAFEDLAAAGFRLHDAVHYVMRCTGGWAYFRWNQRFWTEPI